MVIGHLLAAEARQLLRKDMNLNGAYNMGELTLANGNGRGVCRF
jgi:hypothetical protein